MKEPVGGWPERTCTVGDAAGRIIAWLVPEPGCDSFFTVYGPGRAVIGWLEQETLPYGYGGSWTLDELAGAGEKTTAENPLAVIMRWAAERAAGKE